MKKTIPTFLIWVLLSAANPALGYEAIYTIGTNEQQCYAKAMIGFDSVINARVGVVPEHALELALKRETSEEGEKAYSEEVLRTVLNAYLWQNSPHSYAMEIFYSCAAERGHLKSADNGDIFQ